MTITCIKPPQLQLAASSYRLEIQAGSYRNDDHTDAAGICCEIAGRRSNCDPWYCPHCECDNRFQFCLRRSGTQRDDNAGNCPLGSYSTGEIGDDSFNFGNPTLARGVPNPMVFTGSVWPVRTACIQEYVSSLSASTTH